MNTKNPYLNNKYLWWLEFTTINTTNIVFSYSLQNSITYINTPVKFYTTLHTILKYSVDSLLFSTLDITILQHKTQSTLYHIVQSIFQDIKICFNIKINGIIPSTSNIYSGNTWPERELKEFSNINIINLSDTRKLLLNYDYNNSLKYNHFNSIISDLNT